jgi:hypothetical protein
MLPLIELAHCYLGSLPKTFLMDDVNIANSGGIFPAL